MQNIKNKLLVYLKGTSHAWKMIFYQIFIKIWLENFGFDQTKDFSWENCPNLLDFKILKSQLSKSYDSFLKVATNLEQVYFFLPSYILCNQTWQNYFMDDDHFDDITKSLKEIICLNICLKKRKDLTSIPLKTL